jgi:hypothetical protein
MTRGLAFAREDGLSTPDSERCNASPMVVPSEELVPASMGVAGAAAAKSGLGGGVTKRL